MIIERLKEKLEIALQVLFVLWGIILPWSMAGMQIILGILIVVSIALSIIKHHSPVNYHPFYIFLVIYLLSDLLSAFNTDNWSQSLNAAFSNDWIIIAVPFLVSLPITLTWRNRSFNALLLSAFIVGLYGIVQFFVGVDIFKGGTLIVQGNFFRAIGGYGGAYTYGGNQLFAFAASYAFLILLRKSTIQKSIYLLFSVVIFLSIIASFTRSTWLAAIFVLLLGILIADRKRFLFVTGGVILAVFILFNVIPDLQSRFLSIFSQSQNEGRLTLWATSWEIIKDNLFIGIGHGNFPKYFMIYKVPGFYNAFSHAHNDFLNVTVLNGIVGLIAWVSVWAAWFYYAIRAFIKNVGEEADRQIILSSILGIAGILIAAQFQCFYTDLENNIFWWFLASVALQIVNQSEKKIEKVNLNSE